MVLSTRAGDGALDERSEVGEELALSSETERIASSVGDFAVAAFGLRTKTPWLQERLENSTFQQTRLHAKL